MAIDYEILEEFKNGAIVTPDMEYRVNRAASGGLMHLGTSVDIDVESELITVRPTAKTTRLGLNILRDNYTILESIKNSDLLEKIKKYCR